MNPKPKAIVVNETYIEGWRKGVVSALEIVSRIRDVPMKHRILVCQYIRKYYDSMEELNSKRPAKPQPPLTTLKP